MSLLLLLACAKAPDGPWTPERAIAPALARVDTNGDGIVNAEEWARVDFGGPTFAEADADGNGAVSAEELHARTLAEEPLDWFEINPDKMLELLSDLPNAKAASALLQGGPGSGRPPPAGAAGGAQGGPPGGGGGGQGGRTGGSSTDAPEAWAVMAILAEEITSADPTVPVPDAARIWDVGHAVKLDAPEARAILAELEVAAAKARVPFPARLRASATGAPATGAAGAMPAD